jgi:hypothetical protein
MSARNSSGFVIGFAAPAAERTIADKADVLTTVA